MWVEMIRLREEAVHAITRKNRARHRLERANGKATEEQLELLHQAFERLDAEVAGLKAKAVDLEDRFRDATLKAKAKEYPEGSQDRALELLREREAAMIKVHRGAADIWDQLLPFAQRLADARRAGEKAQIQLRQSEFDQMEAEIRQQFDVLEEHRKAAMAEIDRDYAAKLAALSGGPPSNTMEADHE